MVSPVVQSSEYIATYTLPQTDPDQSHDSFQVGLAVFTKNVLSGDAWIPGVIVKQQSGPVSYQVDVGREESGNVILIIFALDI